MSDKQKNSNHSSINLNQRILKLAFLMLAILVIVFIFLNGNTKEPQDMTLNTNDFLLPSGEKNPTPEPVRLYFKCADQRLMSSEMRIIQTSEDERIEKAIIRELAKGPSAENTMLERVLDSRTEVINIDQKGDILYITLNYAFVNINPISQNINDEKERERLRFSLYTVVNSITSLGEYAQVMVLIDDGNDGLRLNWSDFGFEGETAKSKVRPFSFKNNLVLTPRKLATIIMRNLVDQDINELLLHLKKDNLSTSIEEINALLFSSPTKIIDFQITDFLIGSEDNSAVVWITIQYKTKDGAEITRKNIPLKLVSESRIWKADLDSLKKLTTIDIA